MFDTSIKRFRICAILEAVSWAGLLIGMLFKYCIIGNPIGVQIMGPIHGLLFVLYVIFTFQAMAELKQSKGVLVLGLLAGIPPFTTLWFEWWVLKKRV